MRASSSWCRLRRARRLRTPSRRAPPTRIPPSRKRPEGGSDQAQDALDVAARPDPVAGGAPGLDQGPGHGAPPDPQEDLKLDRGPPLPADAPGPEDRAL